MRLGTNRGYTSVALIAAALVLGTVTALIAEPPMFISWGASQFMRKVRVSRYLNNGSGIERKYANFKQAKICNGWFAVDGCPDNGYKQFCQIRLDDMLDLDYSYRVREYDAEGRQVADTLCSPMNTKWNCLPFKGN